MHKARSAPRQGRAASRCARARPACTKVNLIKGPLSLPLYPCSTTLLSLFHRLVKNPETPSSSSYGHKNLLTRSAFGNFLTRHCLKPKA